LYPALALSFGVSEEDTTSLQILKVDPISEDDSPEVQEHKKQLLDYNDQIDKYARFILTIN
jgi:hypothetical protein